MYNAEIIKSELFGLVGWRLAGDGESDLTESKSGKYYNAEHSVLIESNLRAIAPDLAAFVLGIDILERHFTLHRHWRGSDHAGSLEIQGIIYVLKYIDQIKRAFGEGKKRVLACELSAIKKLRG